MASGVEEFDYVIVGGGSAGATLAARLSEDPRVSVCVLEAGPDDKHPFLHIPAGFIKVIFDPKYTWGYETQPIPSVDGRTLPVMQGRVIGGGGSINGMVWVRGQAEDFDDWAADGNPGWSYDDVLPHFRRIEQRLGASNDTEKPVKGKIPVIGLAWKNQLVDSFVDSAVAEGIPRNPNYNGERQAGAGTYQYNIARGMRYSAAKAFLSQARARKNLKVETNALVRQVLVEDGRARGVRLRKTGDATDRVIHARSEVILAGGAINTPKLLQLSGIGPAALLKQHGIEVVRDLPGVGENLHDHYTPRLTYRAKDVESINGLVRGPKLAGQVLRWLTGRPSILGIGVVLGCAYWQSRPGLDRPNVVITFTPGTFKAGFLGKLDDFPGLTCGVWQLRPDSRGHVRIQSDRPEDKPEIQPNFLADEGDQRTVVEALHLARRIMGQSEIAQHLVEETMPGLATSSDEELLAYSRAQGLCGYHVCGTCRMGPESNPMAVVDPTLKLHGVAGLRVVDASIMPHIISGNTNAATMMIADKAADLIRGGA